MFNLTQRSLTTMNVPGIPLNKTKKKTRMLARNHAESRDLEQDSWVEKNAIKIELKREKFGNRILIQFTTQKSCLNVVHFYYIYLIKPAKGSKFTTIWMRPNHNWISVFGVIVHRCLESSSCQWQLYHWQMVACDLLGWFCILRHQWFHQPWLWDQLCPLKSMQKWKK